MAENTVTLRVSTAFKAQVDKLRGRKSTSEYLDTIDLQQKKDTKLDQLIRRITNIENILSQPSGDDGLFSDISTYLEAARSKNPDDDLVFEGDVWSEAVSEIAANFTNPNYQYSYHAKCVLELGRVIGQRVSLRRENLKYIGDNSYLFHLAALWELASTILRCKAEIDSHKSSEVEANVEV